MGKIAFVEILDKRGNVRERIRVDSFPATAGRSYANAVIVDDRQVSPEHLRLSLDGEGAILVEDLSTENGTRLSKSRERIERHTIPAGGEALLRIGQTSLRIRGDDFAVGPATSFRPLLGALGRYAESAAFAFVAFAAGFGVNVVAFAQRINKNVIWFDLTGMSLALLISFAVWAGFWSFLSRIVVHSFRFRIHVAISGLASFVFILIFTATDYFEFVFSVPVAAGVARYAGFAVIFSLLLYSHLSVMSELSVRKCILSSSLISAGIVGIVLLMSYTSGKEFSNELRFSSVIKPVNQRWVRTVSSEEFFGNLDKLRTKIDTMAREGSGKGVRQN